MNLMSASGMTGALLFFSFFFFFLRSLRSRSRLRLRLRLRPLIFLEQLRQTRHLTSSSFLSPCSTYSKGSSNDRRPSVDAHPRAAQCAALAARHFRGGSPS